ncbi:ankyrin repeat-containing domain protein [Aspergillus tamarii]|uniref:Ankyrin repeat-containing domain protein n=1 Tax=Aspergillus tamarii TaxID=41984 RepID=A0A5N6UAJ2_ASPTM|nr:ankyrin repeat-containing domain protein [Aspergillus tamarii]
MSYNESMELLIKHEHTDLNCQDRKDGVTPLMLSITYKNLELLKALLSDPRTDPNIVDHFGQSPLHLAVYRNSPQMIQLLLQSAWTDVNSWDNNRQTSLVLTAELQKSRATSSLLSIPTVNIDHVDNDGCTALWYAVDECNTEIIQQLMERTSDVHDYWNQAYNKTLFQLAIERGCELAVIRLLQKSDSGHRPEDEGDNHLIYDDDTCFFMAVVSNQVSIARILLARGANINAYNEDGQTALHVACRYNNPRLVDLLLSHPQLDVNFPDHNLQTPLHIALCHDALSSVERLLSMPGIEVDSKDSSGRTPLWCAADRMNISLVRQLQERGADCNTVACCGYTPLAWAALHSNVPKAELLLGVADIQVKAKGSDEVPPLWAACYAGNVEMVDLLLKHGADINERRGRESAPLHISIIMNHIKVTQRLLSEHHRLHHNSRFMHRTALIYAAADGNAAIVELLLNTARIQVKAVDKQRRAALWWAAAGGHIDVVKLLTNHPMARLHMTSDQCRTAYAIAQQREHHEVQACLDASCIPHR